jgi:hypothetical protein
MGGVRVSEETHSSLVGYAKELSSIGKTSREETKGEEGDQPEVDVLNLIQMIVSTVDYQFA